ncbi:MAG: DUF126 domain-containing protein [Peptoniphilus sp.]|nr:DUF126 domain-containing protein [Peptoniphilus sp.]
MVSKEPILFYHTDPETGVVIEKEHSLFERSVKDKIMVFPAGKGSSSVQADGLYKLSVNSTAPKAFIVKDLDTVLVSCAIVMEIPMVNNVEAEFYDVISDDAIIELDADKEEIKVIF